MNKALMGVVLSLMVISMIGAVSAVAVDSHTYIAGKIYNADYTQEISGASVIVNCDGHTPTNIITSRNDGSYNVTFDTSLCHASSVLTVSATKDSLSGIKTGVLQASEDCSKDDNCLVTLADGLDLAIVNVPLVPEFGLIAGTVTVLSALTVFFVIRRK